MGISNWWPFSVCVYKMLVVPFWTLSCNCLSVFTSSTFMKSLRHKVELLMVSSSSVIQMSCAGVVCAAQESGFRPVLITTLWWSQRSGCEIEHAKEFLETHLLFPQTHLPFPQTHLIFPQTHFVFPQTHFIFPQTHFLFPQTHFIFPQTHLLFPQTLFFPLRRKPGGRYLSMSSSRSRIFDDVWDEPENKKQ